MFTWQFSSLDELWLIYINSGGVQDQLTTKPNQAGGRHCKCGHIDHLEV